MTRREAFLAFIALSAAPVFSVTPTFVVKCEQRRAVPGDIWYSDEYDVHVPTGRRFWFVDGRLVSQTEFADAWDRWHPDRPGFGRDC